MNTKNEIKLYICRLEVLRTHLDLVKQIIQKDTWLEFDLINLFGGLEECQSSGKMTCQVKAKGQQN